MAEKRPTVRLNFSRLIPSNILASLAICIACPYIVYQFLVQHNITVLPALSVAGLFPLFFVVQVFIRQRVVDLFGIGALLWIVFLLGSSFLSLYVGDVRQDMFVKVLPIGLAGLMLMLTQFSSRPFFWHIYRYLKTNNQREQTVIYEQYWQTHPCYRQAFVLFNCVWGIGLLLTFFFIVGLIFLLPPEQSAFLVPLVIVVVPTILLVWNVYYKSAKQPGQEEGLKVTEEDTDADQ